MRIDDTIRYDAAPAQVAAMLADPAFIDAKCELMGSLQHDAQVQGDAAGEFTVTSTRTLPTDSFPDVARKLVGATIMIKQVDQWQAPAPDGSRQGTVSMKIVGQPVNLQGTWSLGPDGGNGTVQTVQGDLKASVPLLGGKLERAAEPAIRAALRKEQQAGRTYLAG